MGDEKEEKPKKKEYETLKIKRTGLEKVRDVFAVVRDFLFIIVLLGLVVVILIGISLLMNVNHVLSNVQSGGIGSLLGGSGGIGSILGGFPSSGSPTAGADTATCTLLQEAKNAFLDGDSTAAKQKLGRLKFRSRETNFKSSLKFDCFCFFP